MSGFRRSVGEASEALCDARGEPGERRFPTVAGASRGQVGSPLAEMKKKKGQERS